MGEVTAIEWTDATWNPWHGCEKVSPGCKNCYMYREKKRYGQDPMVVTRSKTTFREPLKWKDPRRVFTCSWSDFFIDQADEWRPEAWDIIRQTPHLTYQILTKRPERIAERLPLDWGSGWPHVWIGVSCENQETADERIPLLLRTPAAVRWISAEPLLGPIYLSPWLWDESNHRCDDRCSKDICCLIEPSGLLHWVVVGGESGPNARPMHPDWVRSLRDQCQSAHVSFHFKQWGEWAPHKAYGILHKGKEGQLCPFTTVCSTDRKSIGEVTYHAFPSVCDGSVANYEQMRKVGKKAVGRMLDGRTWDEFPETNA